MPSPSPQCCADKSAQAIAEGLSEAQRIVERLNDAQRTFILRMKPHLRPQIINERDWEIYPAVNANDDEFSPVFWFGGMRLEWPNGRAKRTFRFNDVGLQVRSILKGEAK